MNMSKVFLSALGYGEKNAVATVDLRKLCKLSERDLRRLVEYLRRQGHVIISCNRGYYLPQTIEEVRRFIRRETARALAIITMLESARRLLAFMEGREKD